MTMIIKFRDTHSVDFDSLPDVSRLALAQAGFSHRLGNVVSSAVAARSIRTFKEALIAECGKDSDEVEKFDAMSAAEKSALGKKIRAKDPELAMEWEIEAREAVYLALIAGTVTLRGEGEEALSPLDRECRAIAKAQIVNIITTKLKVKVPKGDKTIKVPDPKTGEFVDRTMDEMIASRLAHAKFGPAIRAAAEEVLALRASASDEDDDAL